MKGDSMRPGIKKYEVTIKLKVIGNTSTGFFDIAMPSVCLENGDGSYKVSCMKKDTKWYSSF